MKYNSGQAKIRRMLEHAERKWEVRDENPFQSDCEWEEDHTVVEELHPDSDPRDSNTSQMNPQQSQKRKS